jgi:hypothetical protein
MGPYVHGFHPMLTLLYMYSLAVTFFAQSPSLFERLNYIDSYNHVENVSGRILHW